MDKNNCTLKIVYKRIRLIPVPYGGICCSYHQQKYSSPNHSRKQNKQQEPHKTAYLSEKFREEEVRRMGQNQKRVRHKERTWQKNKRADIEQ